MKRSLLAAFAILFGASSASYAQGDAYGYASAYPPGQQIAYQQAYDQYNQGYPQQHAVDPYAMGCDPAGNCYGDPSAYGHGGYYGHETPSVRRSWYASADALFLRRDMADGGPLVIDTLTHRNLATIDDMSSFRFEEGARIQLGAFSEDGPGLGLVYYGITDWHSSHSLSLDNRLGLPGDLGLASLDFYSADRMRIDYDSELQNVEINYLFPYGHVTFLTGFRHIKVKEDFNINSNDFNTGISDYMILTDNRLWGWQIGFRAEYQIHRLGLEVFGKAGLFDNAGYQRNYVRDFGNSYVMRDFEAKGAHIASVGEVGVTATLQLTDVFTLRAGYNLISIGGLALAPEQLDFRNSAFAGANLNQDGEILAHGATVGLEARW